MRKDPAPDRLWSTRPATGLGPAPIGQEHRGSKQTAREGAWSGPAMDRIAKEGKKYLEKSGETSKKGSSGSSKSSTKTSSAKKEGGGSGADKARRVAKKLLK